MPYIQRANRILATSGAPAALLSLLFPILVLVSFLQAAPALAADSPRECVERMAQAVREADTTAFDRRVDIEGIAAEALREVERVAKDPDISSLLPSALTFLAAQGALTNSLTLPLLAGEIREFVLYGVGSGAFAGQKVQGYSSSSILAPLFEMASMGRKDVTWIGVPTDVGNGRVRLPFAVRDEDAAATYTVNGLFARGNDGWRLVAVENMRDLVLRLGRESRDVEGGQMVLLESGTLAARTGR